MPSDLQITNIRDQANANSAITIASDGQITVNQNNPTVTLGSNATFPAGHVLQVVSTEDNSMAGYSNLQHSSFQDLISLAITPSATSSKILLHVSIAGGVNAYGVSYRILQNGSTVADHLGSSTSRTAITFGLVPYASNDDEVATASYIGLFSPSSESAVTYKIQGAGRASDWSYNRGEDATNTSDRANAVSTLTLMEIKG